MDIILLFFLNVNILSFAQTDFEFEEVENIDVTINRQNSTINLSNAWTGGLNVPQFSNIYLNEDSLPDLFVFDRYSNQVKTFVATENGFHFASKYISQFPDSLHDWVLLKDYNHDQLADIFTYGIAGISVYKAKKNNNNHLIFNQVSEQLLFRGNSGNINIFVSRTDIPALVDVNGDGDIDILTFDIVGSYVEYYENQLLELNLPVDSFFFERMSKCWGNFRENPSNEEVILDDDCTQNIPPKQAIHAGSTLLTWDVNQDNTLDLLLGDISGQTLSLLINDGTSTAANMIQQVQPFPKNNSQPLQLFSFPAAYRLLHPNIGNNLIVTINTKPAQSQHHIWQYKATQTTSTIDFQLVTQDFLIEEMIDVGVHAYPVFVDINQDDLLDIAIGNLGQYDVMTQKYKATLTLLTNIGTAQQPAFELQTTDFQKLSQYNLMGLYPTFGDLDGDGDVDMLAGTEAGTILFFENIALFNAPMQLNLAQANLLELADAQTVTPFLFDINNDGLLDLVVGEAKGKLNYFENVGTAEQPNFLLKSETWGQVDVKEQNTTGGYSTPFIHQSKDGNVYVWVTSATGKIRLFTDINQSVFTEIKLNLPFNNIAKQAGISLADLNQDSFLELLLGSDLGGIRLFTQKNTVHTNENVQDTIDLQVYPNPIFGQEKFFISLKNNYLQNNKIRLQLFDTSGWQVFYQNYWLNDVTLDLSLPTQTLPAGIYFIQLTTSDNQLIGIERLVKY